jgi:GTPase SAR1 family protein
VGGSVVGEESVADAGAIVGKVGVGVLRAVAPGAVAWLKTQVAGKTVLFVGPSRAGKTSFINYLRSGAYTDPSDGVPRTQNTKNIGSLQLKSPNGMVSIDLKKIIDTKGQDFPRSHATLVSKYRPHALCILADASSDWSSSGSNPDKNGRAWLEEFLEGICEIRQDDPHIFRRLKSFTILVNKSDLVSDNNVQIKRIEQIKLITKTYFRGGTGRISDMLNVKFLSLIEDHDKGQSAAKAALTVFTPFVRD